MKEKTDWEQRLVDAYLERTLDDTFPELKPYLRPGMRVLDVGCGPGSITLGVAEAVKPGEVVGIDPAESRINTASDLAQRRNLSNVTFKVGDAHKLDLPDNTFDVVYSHTVFHHLIDPVEALREQKRVAKKGGWVIATGVRDWGFSPRYPNCPTLDRVWEGVDRYSESLRSRYQSGEHVPGPRARRIAESYYLDLRAGRKCPEWFSKAGLVSLNLQIKVFRLQYPGADDMEPCTLDIVPALDPTDGMLSETYEDMLAQGFLDEETFQQARQELVAWYKHPHAFHFWGYVFAAGRA